MRIRLLGTAAGGGVPQWNCNCHVCREARSASGRVRPRTQSCVAVTADDQHWFLLNASPDIRAQIESFPPLQPPPGTTRGSGIEAVLLTNADLDHTLGLLSLREGGRLDVHATTEVQHSITEGISISPVLRHFCDLQFTEPPQRLSKLLCHDGSASGLQYQQIPLPGKPPRFARGPAGLTSGSAASTMEKSSHVIGYRIIDEKTGGRLLFLPDVSALEPQVAGLLRDCDALLFDGTFWSENEMQERGVGNLTASAMGHLPISGEHGSLKTLAQLKPGHKIYIHINNTNPILFEDSPERVAVTAAGCVVGFDGMKISI